MTQFFFKSKAAERTTDLSQTILGRQKENYILIHMKGG